MRPQRKSGAAWQLVWGLCFIVAGLLLLFDRFYDVISFEEALRILWPVALIGVGTARLVRRLSTSRPETE
jgi:hypothetical protein